VSGIREVLERRFFAKRQTNVSSGSRAAASVQNCDRQQVRGRSSRQQRHDAERLQGAAGPAEFPSV